MNYNENLFFIIFFLQMNESKDFHQTFSCVVMFCKTVIVPLMETIESVTITYVSLEIDILDILGFFNFLKLTLNVSDTYM